MGPAGDAYEQEADRVGRVVEALRAGTVSGGAAVEAAEPSPSARSHARLFVDDVVARSGWSQPWMRRLGVMISSLVLAMIAACSGQDPTPSASTSSSSSVPVIVDYSPTVSDVGGLMYLLSHPMVDIRAISLPATGEAGCDLGREVTFGVLAMFGRDDIPVACDTERPGWAGDWPDEFLAGQSNLRFPLPKSEAVGDARSGPDLIAESVLASERPVVIWAVAPLTNVARALERHPQIVERIDRIVIMGGAVDVPGNTSDQAAEWNLWVDARSAASVVSSGVPITVVPLDATNDVPVPVWYGIALANAEQTPAVNTLSSYVRLFRSVTSGFYFFWDELAATAIANPSLVRTETATIRVIEDGPDAGATIRSPEGHEITLATGVPVLELFYEEFLSTLAGSPVAIGPTATTEQQGYFDALNQVLAATRSELNAMFESGAGSDAYDAAAASEAVDRVLAAHIAAIPLIEQLSPPADLLERHQSYLTALRELVEVKDDIVAAAASAHTWEDVESRALELWPDGPGACRGLVEEGRSLGLDPQLPC